MRTTPTRNSRLPPERLALPLPPGQLDRLPAAPTGCTKTDDPDRSPRRGPVPPHPVPALLYPRAGRSLRSRPAGIGLAAAPARGRSSRRPEDSASAPLLAGDPRATPTTPPHPTTPTPRRRRPADCAPPHQPTRQPVTGRGRTDTGTRRTSSRLPSTPHTPTPDRCERRWGHPQHSGRRPPQPGRRCRARPRQRPRPRDAATVGRRVQACSTSRPLSSPGHGMRTRLTSSRRPAPYPCVSSNAGAPGRSTPARPGATAPAACRH
ncbi:hypothetical protein HD597_000185 [Nonomuraea thailandensis]|uniref:Uncharacterized protein n=1 Tax=Nonomuraea thailandensis TaxID=1188745 RepID=A0A9X2G8U8_9ACTN|nr:hypothetical protein [Nonomuraea thailandensis]